MSDCCSGWFGHTQDCPTRGGGGGGGGGLFDVPGSRSSSSGGGLFDVPGQSQGGQGGQGGGLFDVPQARKRRSEGGGLFDAPSLAGGHCETCGARKGAHHNCPGPSQQQTLLSVGSKAQPKPEEEKRPKGQLADCPECGTTLQRAGGVRACPKCSHWDRRVKDDSAGARFARDVQAAAGWWDRWVDPVLERASRMHSKDTNRRRR